MRIPAAPLLFGLLLAAPFLWGAATLLSGDLARWGAARIGAPYIGPNLQLFLAPVMLPFMAGALWGLAARTSGARALVAMLLAAAPALWMFLTGGGGAASLGVNLIFGFAGVLLLDFAFSRWGLAPPWWLPLRLWVNLSAIAALALTVV